MEDIVLAEPRLQLSGFTKMKGFRYQKDLAEATGYSLNTVNGVMTGQRHPSPEFQVRLAAALGISLKELRRLL
jgi:transcriptional regulator with XRE-family HTH domain